MLIPSFSNHCTIRFQTNGVSITRIRRHMNITGHYRHQITPTVYIALSIFIITCSRRRTV